MKPIIGMISPRNTDDNNPFDNYTKFVNTYAKRVIDVGGIPIGIIFPTGKFEIDEVELCDGFILQGGPKLESYQINVIKYAIDRQKPILGICLGMQTMAGYSWVYDELGDTLTYSEIDEFFKPEYEEYFLDKINGHDELNPFYKSQIEKSKHHVILDRKSKIHDIYKTNLIKEPSLHNYAVRQSVMENSKIFKITGKSDDGIIEVIEGKNPAHFIVGVQFHPELEDKNSLLFKRLIKEAKRKTKGEILWKR